jgi:hypothetical protein
MAKYKVRINNLKGDAVIERDIEAGTPDEAYQLFVKNNQPLSDSDLFINWGVMGKKVFKPPHFFGRDPSKSQEEIRVEQQKQEQKRKKELAEKKHLEVNELIQKFKEGGFRSLDPHDLSLLIQIVDSCFISDNLETQQLLLLKWVLHDEAAFRFFSLRSNSKSSIQQQTTQEGIQSMLGAMNANLSNISSKSSTTSAASVFTGLAAARHLGEQIAEDLGGGDE